MEKVSVMAHKKKSGKREYIKKTLKQKKNPFRRSSKPSKTQHQTDLGNNEEPAKTPR